MKFLIFLIFSFSLTAQVYKFEAGNSDLDDYTPTFRLDDSGMQVWMTTNKRLNNNRYRSIEVYKVVNGEFKTDPTASKVFKRKINTDDYEVYDGSPNFARNYCDNRKGVFVSNRRWKGKDRKNDIYELNLSANGWKIDYIEKVNSDHWDDTPAISPDASFMIFASDRHKPGSGKADLFISRKVNDEWEYPVPLNSINTDDHSEESPYIDQNGNLYFSSNRNGNYDIWVVKLDEKGNPVGSASTLDYEGVNTKEFNERNPSISPGNGWFMFASDRDTSKLGDDIYYVKINEDFINLDVKVLLMTRNYGSFGSAVEDESVSLRTQVKAIDLNTGEQINSNSNENGVCEISIPRRAKDKLEFDTGVRKIIISAINPDESKYGELIPAVDTLVFNTWDEVNVRHNLYLWDTSSYYNPECRYEFPVKNVRFFVNAYWCPTTINFKHLTPCTSMFIEDDCKVSPVAPCETNEIYRYDLSYEINDNKIYENCIDYRDFRANGERYSSEVDAAIEKLRNEMASVFKVPCVQRAINEKKEIQVEVIGFTDPNPLFQKCHYLGSNIEFLQDGLVIEGQFYPIQFREENQAAYTDSTIKHMMKFRDTDYGGNQLLSDLRGIYTSILLDKVWYNEIDAYRKLKDEGLIVVKTWGEAINQDNLEDAQKRSVQVRVTVPTLEPEVVQGIKPKAGSVVELNYTDCTE